MSLSKKNIIHLRGAALMTAAVLAAYSGAAAAQTSASIESLFGVMKLREHCYQNCSEQLEKDLDYCEAQYGSLLNAGVCVGEALAVYYNCTENCPPFEAPAGLIEFLPADAQ